MLVNPDSRWPRKMNHQSQINNHMTLIPSLSHDSFLMILSKCFSNFNEFINHLGIFLRCRFSFTRSEGREGKGTRNSAFLKSSKWCCWSKNHIRSIFRYILSSPRCLICKWDKFLEVLKTTLKYSTKAIIYMLPSMKEKQNLSKFNYYNLAEYIICKILKLRGKKWYF